MQRLRRSAESLRAALPPDDREAPALPHKLAPQMKTTFATLALPDFVRLYGLDDFDFSMQSVRAFPRKDLRRACVQAQGSCIEGRVLRLNRAKPDHSELHHARPLSGCACRRDHGERPDGGHRLVPPVELKNACLCVYRPGRASAGGRPACHRRARPIGRLPSRPVVLEQKHHQISILLPSSTTELFGRFRKSAAPLALWCICANSFSRQTAMPLPIVGITMSRDRK